MFRYILSFDAGYGNSLILDIHKYFESRLISHIFPIKSTCLLASSTKLNMQDEPGKIKKYFQKLNLYFSKLILLSKDLD